MHRIIDAFMADRRGGGILIDPISGCANLQASLV
jgi:hypothetical protein